MRVLLLAGLVIACMAGCGSGEGNPSGPSSGGQEMTAVGVDQEVTFRSRGVTIYASLRAPLDANAETPAAVIIAGSGPVDRDGNVSDLPDVKMDMYPWIADRLAEAGYASLRYDKLGSGKTEWGPYTESQAGKLSFEDSLLREAQDALAFLAKQPGVDSQRLALAGHSEGGMIALAVADDPGPAPAPERLALIEPLPVPILSLIRSQLAEQISAAAKGGLISGAEAAALGEWLSRGIRELRKGEQFSSPTRPLSQPGGAAEALQAAIEHYAYEPQTRILRGSEDRYDPLELAARVSPPTQVLVTCGTKDISTPCSIVKPLAEAFEPGLARFEVIPEMIHVLRDIGAADPLAISARQDISYPFSQDLADVMAGFFK